MRHLLFLAHRIPYPPNKGEKIRAFYPLQHLARSWNVHLGCLIHEADERQYIEPLQRIAAAVGAFPINKRRQKLKSLAVLGSGRPMMPEFYNSPALHRWVRNTLATNPISAIFVSTVVMAQYIPPGRTAPVLLDLVDIDSEKFALYAQESRWPMCAVWSREARTLLNYERKSMHDSAHAFFVTPAEAERFALLAPDCVDRIGYFENGVDLDGFNPSFDFSNPFNNTGPNLVFTGHMDYRPNADAVIWFADTVLPLIVAKHPTASFHIVGANPGPSVIALANRPGIHVTGRVPDTRPYIAHADVSVSPLRMARGVQNKVLEAMALARPVVASPQAFEGIRAIPCQDLLVADGPDQFAAAVLSVLDGAHPAMGHAARAAMERSYHWSKTLRTIDAALG